MRGSHRETLKYFQFDGLPPNLRDSPTTLAPQSTPVTVKWRSEFNKLSVTHRVKMASSYFQFLESLAPCPLIVESNSAATLQHSAAPPSLT